VDERAVFILYVDCVFVIVEYAVSLGGEHEQLVLFLALFKVIAASRVELIHDLHRVGCAIDDALIGLRELWHLRPGLGVRLLPVPQIAGEDHERVNGFETSSKFVRPDAPRRLGDSLNVATDNLVLEDSLAKLDVFGTYTIEKRVA
jgi:hypothetical protein